MLRAAARSRSGKDAATMADEDSGRRKDGGGGGEREVWWWLWKKSGREVEVVRRRLSCCWELLVVRERRLFQEERPVLSIGTSLPRMSRTPPRKLLVFRNTPLGTIILTTDLHRNKDTHAPPTMVLLVSSLPSSPSFVSGLSVVTVSSTRQEYPPG